MCVMPDLNEKFGGASLNDHHWYPVEKSVCTRRFDFSMGSLITDTVLRHECTLDAFCRLSSKISKKSNSGRMTAKKYEFYEKSTQGCSRSRKSFFCGSLVSLTKLFPHHNLQSLFIPSVVVHWTCLDKVKAAGNGCLSCKTKPPIE